MDRMDVGKGLIHIVEEINCYNTEPPARTWWGKRLFLLLGQARGMPDDTSKAFLTIWLVPPGNNPTDYENRGVRIVGPIDWSHASSVSKALESFLTSLGYSVRTETFADD